MTLLSNSMPHPYFQDAVTILPKMPETYNTRHLQMVTHADAGLPVLKSVRQRWQAHQ
jgi:hypothetical protein